MSKNQIDYSNFFEANLKKIRCEQPLPCDLYIEMQPEQRLVKLHRRGEILSRERLRRFQEKNIQSLFVALNDKIDFENYLLRPAPSKSRAANDFIQSLTDTMSDVEAQEVWRRAKETAQKLAFPTGDPSDIFALWDKAPLSAMRSATLSVLIACAVQDFEPSLLADLALACLAPTGMALPARVGLWIEQRNERFDGSGRPKGLQGFEIDDMAQLLAITDAVNIIFDETQKKIPSSMTEAKEALESLNSKPPFPQLFNPDLFFAVIEKVFESAPSSVNSPNDIAA
jgi:HD-GYP domain-containing protein (c-di-GMP phosphodiesterase class II)